MSDRTSIIAICYKTEYERLVGYAERLLGSMPEAEDIVQDAFERLLQSNLLLSSDTISGLVFTIVRRLLADYFRRRTYRLNYRPTVFYADDAADLCSLHEVEEWLERGIARLSPECQECYRLHVLGGMKISEIQLVTQQNYKQLEYQLGIARRSMRQHMKRFAS